MVHIDWKHYPEHGPSDDHIAFALLDAWTAEASYWYTWIGLDTPDSTYYLGSRSAL